MTILFWGLTTIMLGAAIGFVALPLKAAKLSAGTPATLAIITLPLSACGLYFLLGSPGLESAAANPAYDAGNYSQAPPSNARLSGSLGSVASLVDGLRARLQREPDDAGGWLLLARSYQHLSQHDDALAAYARAQSLGTADVEFEASLLGPMLSTGANPHAVSDGDE